MNCRQARRDMRRRLDESLELERELELEAHLSGCERCGGVDRRARMLEETLARLPEPPLAGLDVERAVAVVRARRVPVQPDQSPGPRLGKGAGLALTLAASLVLWLVFGTQWGGSETAPEETGDPLAGGPVPGSAGDPGNRSIPAGQDPASGGSDGLAVDPGEPMDLGRLAAVRAEVRDHLHELGLALPSAPTDEDLTVMAERFDLATLDLVRGDWPVVRIVEGALMESDPPVARAAARYLGLRGSQSSVRHLRQALHRDDLARDVALALGDMGSTGVLGLAQAMDVPRARTAAIDGLVRVGSPSAAGYLSLAYQREANPVLLDGLQAMGADALPELLGLHAGGHLARDRFLSALRGVEGAGAWCIERLDAAGSGVDPALLLGAGALEPEFTARWLEDHLHVRGLREVTREFLPAIPGTPGVESLIRLHRDTRFASEDLAQATLQALQLDGERFATVAMGREPGSLETREILLQLLLAAPDPSGLRALSVCVADAELSDTDRTAAALRLGQSELPDALPVLAGVFATCSASDRKLAAACLVGVARLGGVSAVEPLVAFGPRRTYQNILQLLQTSPRGGRSAPSIYKLARELRTFLSARDRMTLSISP